MTQICHEVHSADTPTAFESTQRKKGSSLWQNPVPPPFYSPGVCLHVSTPPQTTNLHMCINCSSPTCIFTIFVFMVQPECCTGTRGGASRIHPCIHPFCPPPPSCLPLPLLSVLGWHVMVALVCSPSLSLSPSLYLLCTNRRRPGWSMSTLRSLNRACTLKRPKLRSSKES